MNLIRRVCFEIVENGHFNQWKTIFPTLGDMTVLFEQEKGPFIGRGISLKCVAEDGDADHDMIHADCFLRIVDEAHRGDVVSRMRAASHVDGSVGRWYNKTDHKMLALLLCDYLRPSDFPGNSWTRELISTILSDTIPTDECICEAFAEILAVARPEIPDPYVYMWGPRGFSLRPDNEDLA